MCILQAARSPGSSHVAFPSEAHQGTGPRCLPNLTGRTRPFGAQRGLAESFQTFAAPLWEEVNPLPASFPAAFLGGRRRVGPPELRDKKKPTTVKPTESWLILHARSYSNQMLACLPAHATLPTLIRSSPNRKFQFFVPWAIFNKKPEEEKDAHVLRWPTRGCGQQSISLLLLPEVAMLLSFSLVRLNLFQEVRKC